MAFSEQEHWSGLSFPPASVHLPSFPIQSTGQNHKHLARKTEFQINLCRLCPGHRPWAETGVQVEAGTEPLFHLPSPVLAWRKGASPGQGAL